MPSAGGENTGIDDSRVTIEAINCDLIGVTFTPTQPLFMEIFESAAVIWFIVGFLFFLLEFVVPGLILFFFGAGAWIVAIVLLFIDISFNTQLTLFIVGSLITIMLFRRTLKRLLAPKTHNTSQLLQDEMIGKKGIAETGIAPGQNGKVQFKGTIWTAASNDVISAGEEVLIKRNESILLFVESLKK